MRLVLVADPSRPVAGGAGADLVEHRIDLGSDAGPVARSSDAGTLITVRSRAEGGAFDGSRAEAAALLARHADTATFLDAERDVISILRSAVGARVRVLASLHGRRPIDLPREGVFAWKIARPVETPDDMIAVLDEARRLAVDFVCGRGPPAFVVPYGPLGVGLRVVCAAIAEGAGIDPFVYGVADDASPAFLAKLPHVPAISTLRDELRLGEVSGRARLFGLVGRPPSRSPSPRFHNTVFRGLGEDSVYFPEVDVDADAAMRLPYAGMSVTTPLKEEVATRCDSLQPSATDAGAVNTVVRAADGSTFGANTDVDAVRDWPGDFVPERGPALVIGGGGFARAAIVALRSSGYVVRVAGRGRARAAAASLGVEFAGEEPALRGDERVVVNATPVGADGTLPADWVALAESVPTDVCVIDGPYGRGGSGGAFARAVRARSIETVDGAYLFYVQGLGQAGEFLRNPAETEFASIAMYARRSLRTLVLVGPRAAGKTTVGRLVARQTGRPFVDTDEEIGRVTGRPAGRVLAELGEVAFRRLEASVVARALARRGAVIALGGGALADSGTRARIPGGAAVVSLDVSPVDAAQRIEDDSTFRPRLTAEGDRVAECARVAAERAPQYALASQRVDTTGRVPTAIADDVIAHWINLSRES